MIIGAGKTGMDAVSYLVKNGIDPDKIRWIMASDSYIIDRDGSFEGKPPIIKGGVYPFNINIEPKDSIFFDGYSKSHISRKELHTDSGMQSIKDNDYQMPFQVGKCKTLFKFDIKKAESILYS